MQKLKYLEMVINENLRYHIIAEMYVQFDFSSVLSRRFYHFMLVSGLFYYFPENKREDVVPEFEFLNFGHTRLHIDQVL